MHKILQDKYLKDVFKYFSWPVSDVLIVDCVNRQTSRNRKAIVSFNYAVGIVQYILTTAFQMNILCHLNETT